MMGGKLMSYWQGVRYLVQQDIKNARWKNLTFIVFISYTVLFSYTSFVGAVVEGIELDSLLTEYIVLILFSMIGLLATHLYTIGDMKRDLLGERLIYWRTLTDQARSNYMVKNYWSYTLHDSVNYPLLRINKYCDGINRCFV